MNNQPVISLIFGTRPEIIKLSPLIRILGDRKSLKLCCVFTGQQRDIAPEFTKEFNITVDHELDVMRHDQELAQLIAKLLAAIATTLTNIEPDLVVVQGDTSSALAGALAAHMLKIPVVHVEAGLRTNNRLSPFPEESNRVLISKLASIHCAATNGNRENLINEGIDPKIISVTGNTIVDMVEIQLSDIQPSTQIKHINNYGDIEKLIVMTAHRRENFSGLMDSYFETVLTFLNEHPSYSLIVPVHPNPTAKSIFDKNFKDHVRVHPIRSLPYKDFISLLMAADLVISDSGGIQEEVASLNKPLIILRENTERPEALSGGIAHLAPNAKTLQELLEKHVRGNLMSPRTGTIVNPFGDGHAASRIADLIENFCHMNPTS